jgi:hypothetical protein
LYKIPIVESLAAMKSADKNKFPTMHFQSITENPLRSFRQEQLMRNEEDFLYIRKIVNIITLKYK